MEFQLRGAILRPWRLDDAEALQRNADSPGVAAFMRDSFPHPYTRADATEWLRRQTQAPHEDGPADLALAVEVEGEAAGGIGLHRRSDVNRFNAEIGYWLGEAHWGKASPPKRLLRSPPSRLLSWTSPGFTPWRSSPIGRRSACWKGRASCWRAVCGVP